MADITAEIAELSYNVRGNSYDQALGSGYSHFVVRVCISTYTADPES